MRRYCIAWFWLAMCVWAEEPSFLYIQEQDAQTLVKSMPTYVIKDDDWNKMNLSNFRLARMEYEGEWPTLYIDVTFHAENWQKVPVTIKVPPKRPWEIWKIRVEQKLMRIFSMTRDITLKVKIFPDAQGNYQCTVDVVNLSGFDWLSGNLKDLLLQGVQNFLPKNLRQFVLKNPFPEVSFSLDVSPRFPGSSYLVISSRELLKILKLQCEQGRIQFHEKTGIIYENGSLSLQKPLVCPDGEKIEFREGKLYFPTLEVQENRLVAQTFLTFTNLHFRERDFPGIAPIAITLPVRIRVSENGLGFELAEEDNDVRFFYTEDRLVARLANAINLAYKNQLMEEIAHFRIPQSDLNIETKLQSQKVTLEFRGIQVWNNAFVLFYKVR